MNRDRQQSNVARGVRILAAATIVGLTACGGNGGVTPSLDATSQDEGVDTTPLDVGGDAPTDAAGDTGSVQDAPGDAGG